MEPEPAGVSRRTVLKGIGAVGLAAASPAWLSARAGAATGAADVDWEAFDALIAREFQRMGLVGAAVAVVSADRVLHTKTLGRRDTDSREPVDRSTHFLVASTTKSMTSLLVATFVDDGKLHWDQRVVDVWPDFRAPTDELTRTLRVRDLMSMGTGIDEPAALSGLHQGDPTALQLLQSIDNLPVAAKPGRQFIYNNTVYAVAGYLPPLVDGVSAADLTAAYAELMRDRVYRPAGMADALLADDPRGRVANFSRGHGLALTGGRSTLPYGPVGSYWPVGGTVATLDDMAAYVRLHLRNGVSVDGRRVVSAENLTERYEPQVAIPLDHTAQPDLDPDAVASAYGMGLIHERYRDGISLLWHNGGIDGFTSYIGFLPDHDLGLVVLNSMNPTPIGFFFYIYVVNLLLGELLDLNRGVPAKVRDAYRQAVDGLDQLGRGTKRVDPRAVEPFLGYYEGGYRLLVEDGTVVIRVASRVLPLRTAVDGGYIVSDGLFVGVPVTLDRDRDGTPRIVLQGLETVRRTVGFAA
jgi:CubicO group peptidase (beta-lactamase class C family)